MLCMLRSRETSYYDEEVTPLHLNCRGVGRRTVAGTLPAFSFTRLAVSGVSFGLGMFWVSQFFTHRTNDPVALGAEEEGMWSWFLLTLQCAKLRKL